MIRRIPFTALLLSVAVVGWMSGFVQAEEPLSRLPDPAFEAQPIQPASYAVDGNGVGLEDRVKALESVLTQMKDKEAAAKKKAEGKPTVTVGGRFYAVWSAYTQDANSFAQIGNQRNGFEFRRARIFMKGSAFHVIDYKVQYDFTDTQRTKADDRLQATSFRDVYLGINELPYLNHVRIGHFKEPMGLEENASSKYITFIERSLTSALLPYRNIGIMEFSHTVTENATWAIGAFTTIIDDDPPVLRSDGGATAFSTRFSYLPWYDEATEGRGLLHLWAGYSYRDIPGDTAWFGSRPEDHLGSRVVDTDNIPDTPSYQLLTLEGALVYGPLSFQTEYVGAFLDRDTGANPWFSGYYVHVSYFLTGENRNYMRSRGYFGRVKPFENFFCVRDEDGYIRAGKGAWELAYRFSYLDLDSAGITGGNVSDHTFGLNWYLNPYTRMQFNYINSGLRRDGLTGNMSIFQGRVSVEF